MSNNPLVSIIIPTYNRGKYVKKAINSALNQTYENIEVIVIDDCPDNPVRAIVENIEDDRLTYYQNNQNMGAPASRNRGLKLADGEYVNFLDDDDEILPEKIARQIDKFQNSDNENLGVVTCDVKYEREDIDTVKENRKKGEIYKDLLGSYCVYGTETMLIKRKYVEQINGFDESLKSNQEYDLAIRLAKICEFDNIDYIGSIKRESENQISFNFRKKIDGTKYLYKKHKDEYKKYGFKFFLYNRFRFQYLFFRYYMGLYLGRKIYNIFA